MVQILGRSGSFGWKFVCLWNYANGCQAQTAVIGLEARSSNWKSSLLRSVLPVFGICPFKPRSKSKKRSKDQSIKKALFDLNDQRGCSLLVDSEVLWPSIWKYWSHTSFILYCTFVSRPTTQSQVLCCRLVLMFSLALMTGFGTSVFVAQVTKWIQVRKIQFMRFHLFYHSRHVRGGQLLMAPALFGFQKVEFLAQ